MNKVKQLIACLMFLMLSLSIAQAHGSDDDQGPGLGDDQSSPTGLFACKHENGITGQIDTYFLINQNIGQLFCPRDFSCSDCEDGAHDPSCRYFKEPI